MAMNSLFDILARQMKLDVGIRYREELLKDSMEKDKKEAEKWIETLPENFKEYIKESLNDEQ